MKKFKALSFFLAVSIVLWSSAHPIKVSAAENGIWFFEDFQNLERVYSQTSTGEPFGSNYLKFGINQSKAETATSDDNSYLHIFANTVGGTLWLETPPNLPIKNTDKQVLEFDMYIPNGGIGNGDIVSLQMTSAVAPTTEIISFGNVSNSKAVINDYPTNSWFKIQYVFEYSAAIPRYYTKLIHQGEETFLRGHDLSHIPNLAANGFGKLRIATTSSIVSGVEFYLDNFQYYKDLTVAKSEYATSAVTDYSESFNSYGPSYNFTGTGDYGNLRVGIAAPATAKTVTHPVDGRKVLNFNTGAGNKALWVENSFPFSARTTGTQIFEVELYIPEGQLSSSVDQIGFTVKNGTSSYNLNLLSPTSTTGITTGSTANTKEFPFGKWFKIQFIFNYSSSRYEANIIDDGVIIPAAVIGGINNPFNTDGIRYFRMGHDTNASGSTKNIDSHSKPKELVDSFKGKLECMVQQRRGCCRCCHSRRTA